MCSTTELLKTFNLDCSFCLDVSLDFTLRLDLGFTVLADPIAVYAVAYRSARLSYREVPFDWETVLRLRLFECIMSSSVSRRVLKGFVERPETETVEANSRNDLRRLRIRVSVITLFSTRLPRRMRRVFRPINGVA